MAPPQQAHHHHGGGKQHSQQRDDGAEMEVKKIYLLTPMPVQQQQQQHLGRHKAGGAQMPAVQNHIHLGQTAYMPGGKHRHSSAQSTSQSSYDQQEDQFQQPQTAGTKQQHKSGDVKILPIVVIPPMAPVPPIQLSNDRQMSSRMTLSPHFNNYLMTPVASGAHDRRMSQMSPSGRFGNSGEYGGSLGGSLFREQFASGRWSQSRARNNQQRLLAARPSGRDYDYADYDDQPSRMSPDLLERDSLVTMHANYQPMRRNQLRNGDYYNQRPVRPRERYNNNDNLSSDNQRIRNIRDIIEALNRQPPSSVIADEDEFANADSSNEHGVLARVQTRRARPGKVPPSQLDVDNLLDTTSRQASMEISLDELGLLSDQRDQSAPTSREQHQHQHQQQQPQQARNHDLSSLYYDQADQTSGDGQPVVDRGYLGASRSGATSGASNYRPMRSDERGQLAQMADDEWRFDSIKSVTHAAPNSTIAAQSSKVDATTPVSVPLGKHNRNVTMTPTIKPII